MLGFERRAEAEQFLKALQERFAKFGLELHPEKTRLIEFGRFARSNRRERGKGKPETFDFLGFTHICGKHPKTGYFLVRRKTIGKRLAKKLREVKQLQWEGNRRARLVEDLDRLRRQLAARRVRIPAAADVRERLSTSKRWWKKPSASNESPV